MKGFRGGVCRDTHGRWHMILNLHGVEYVSDDEYATEAEAWRDYHAREADILEGLKKYRLLEEFTIKGRA